MTGKWRRFDRSWAAPCPVEGRGSAWTKRLFQKPGGCECARLRRLLREIGRGHNTSFLRRAPTFLMKSADQYFGRCEFAHSRACQIGSRRGRIARSFFVVGRFSIRSRQRQKARNFGYIVLPSSTRLNAKVLGSMKKSASVSSEPSR